MYYYDVQTFDDWGLGTISHLLDKRRKGRYREHECSLPSVADMPQGSDPWVSTWDATWAEPPVL